MPKNGRYPNAETANAHSTEIMMSEFYDPREPNPSRPRHKHTQSALSVALEALGGGLVIAVVVYVLGQPFDLWGPS